MNIKTNFVCLAVGLSFVAAVPAFANSFGVELGPLLTSFSTPLSGSGTEFTGGVFYEADVAPMFSLQPELRYENKTAGSSSLDYLVVPVLLKGNIATGTIVTPSLALGPDLGLKISGPDGTNTVDFSLDFGAGVSVDVAPNVAALFDFRYELGLTDVVSGFDSKTRDIALLFGAKFKL